MAWDPTQPVTAAPLLSAPVRANFQALDAALMHALPAIPNHSVLVTAAGSVAGLPGGSPGQVLTLDPSAIPAWITASGVSFPILAPAGTLAAPSYSFAAAPSVGMTQFAVPPNTGVVFSIQTGSMFFLWGTPTQLQFGAYLNASLNFSLISDATQFRVTSESTLIHLEPHALTGGTFSVTVGATAIGGGLELLDTAQPALAPKLGVGLQSGVYLPAMATAPATPPSGYGVLYIKANKGLYLKNDAGVETALGGGSGAGLLLLSPGP